MHFIGGGEDKQKKCGYSGVYLPRMLFVAIVGVLILRAFFGGGTRKWVYPPTFQARNGCSENLVAGTSCEAQTTVFVLVRGRHAHGLCRT